MAGKTNTDTPTPDVASLETALRRITDLEARVKGDESRIAALEKQDKQKTENWRRFVSTHVDSTNRHGKV